MNALLRPIQFQARVLDEGRLEDMDRTILPYIVVERMQVTLSDYLEEVSVLDAHHRD